MGLRLRTVVRFFKKRPLVSAHPATTCMTSQFELTEDTTASELSRSGRYNVSATVVVTGCLCGQSKFSIILLQLVTVRGDRDSDSGYKTPLISSTHCSPDAWPSIDSASVNKPIFTHYCSHVSRTLGIIPTSANERYPLNNLYIAFNFAERYYMREISISINILIIGIQ